MKHWRIVWALGFLSVATSTNVQAQGLLDRLEAILNQPAAPAPAPSPATAPVVPPDPMPDPVVPEVLPSPVTPVNPPLRSNRPSLGVTVDPLTDEIIRQRGIPVRRGALITAIVPGAPADQAGLPLGAVIVALDGQRIDSPTDLAAAIRATSTDRPVELSYYDGDRLFRKRVQLFGEPQALQPLPIAPPPERTLDRRAPSLGQQLGGLGQRPLLGRVGQLIDDLVAPAAGEAPLPHPSAELNESAILREQIALMRQELDELRARLLEVEEQLARSQTPE